MTCAACSHTNLAGGVRCVYCGIHFPKALDFEVESGTSAPALDKGAPLPNSGTGKSRGGFSLIGLGIIAFKWKALLALFKLGPLLTTFGSMALFIGAESRLFGWKLAAGFAACILIHELGHVVMNLKNGLKCSAPMFIPFAGAVIMVKHFPSDPRVESECGAGGPGAGLLASLGCSLLGVITGDRFWFTLAILSYGINLFNLIPFWQLDGSRISSAFSPGNWDFILVTLLLIVIKAPSPLLWVLLIVLFLLRLGRGGYTRYNLALPAVRARMALVYLVLCLSLAYGIDLTRAAHPEASIRGTTSSSSSQSGNAATERSRSRITQQTQSPEDRAEEQQVFHTLDIVFFSIESIVGIAGWLGIAALLARASNEKFGKLGIALALPMITLMPCLMISYSFLGLKLTNLAYLAATLAAFIFAAYKSHHSRSELFGNSRAALMWRCLGWAAAAALMVAYWADNLWVAMGVAILAGAYYARQPWLVYGAAARAAELLGDLNRAIALRNRALGFHPPEEAARQLLLAQVRAYLVLGQGGNALAATDAITTLPNTMTKPADYLVSAYRAAALIRLDRFEEVMTECERLLRTPHGDRTGAVRLFLVRRILAEMALYRGWDDEAIAQADQVSRMSPQSLSGTARTLAADAVRTRAMALIDSGKMAETQTILEQYRQWDRQPWAQAIESMLRASVSLKQGSPQSGLAEIDEVARRLPGSLETLYLRGKALLATGKSEEGRDILSRLAAGFPNEHWGKLAAAT
jgi:Zn-dependent protease/tetratricopeptide (TPR) repeat protein